MRTTPESSRISEAMPIILNPFVGEQLHELAQRARDVRDKNRVLTNKLYRHKRSGIRVRV